jgi:hypothetical protein
MKPPFSLSANGKYLISPPLSVPFLSLFPGLRYVIPTSDFEVVDGVLYLDEECAEVRIYDPYRKGFWTAPSEELSLLFRGTIKPHLQNQSLVNLVKFVNHL